MKTDLDKIIQQGNQQQIQDLFNTIFNKMRDVFTEENIPGLISYMLECTLQAFNKWIIETEYEYSFDFDMFNDMLVREVNNYVKELKQSIKEKDLLFKKAKEALYGRID